MSLPTYEMTSKNTAIMIGIDLLGSFWALVLGNIGKTA